MRAWKNIIAVLQTAYLNLFLPRALPWAIAILALRAKQPKGLELLQSKTTARTLKILARRAKQPEGLKLLQPKATPWVLPASMRSLKDCNHVFLSFLMILFIFCSCSSKNLGWTFEKVEGSIRDFSSEKLSFKTKDPFRSLTLSFIKTDSGSYCLLDTLSLPFPVEQDLRTEIAISAGQTDHTFYADRLEGGQRLLLSNEAATFLFNCLSNDQPVSISVGRYRGEFSRIPK